MTEPAPLTLSALYVYPIKSCAGISLNRAELGPRGVRYDRHWMVIDQAGRMLTQRERPRMRLIRPDLDERGLTLHAPGMPDLRLPLTPTGPLCRTSIWGTPLEGFSVSEAAARWLSEYLGDQLELIALPDDLERWQEGKPYRSLLSYADGNPYHLVSEATLAALNRSLTAPTEAINFRPNLVVRGGEAYAEDYWRRIRVGEVRFQVVESCARCAVVNVTPTGRMAAEPLRTLSRSRRTGNAILFGQHLIQDAPEQARTGRLTVGDPVQVLEVADTPNPFY